MGPVTNSPGLFGRRTAAQPAIPKGDVLGTYDTYLEAQHVIDRLAKAEFDVQHLSIVGSDLKSVERVTGRLNWGRAALGGAVSGAWIGLFFGLLSILFVLTTNFAFVLAAMLIGAGFGVMFGIVTYAVTRRNRDFTSTQQLVVTSYQVIIDPEYTARAQAVLAEPEPERD
jgi:hypothetical protein